MKLETETLKRKSQCQKVKPDTRRSARLLADVQSLDEIRVALGVFHLEVVEQPAALADEHQQSAARVVILCVGLEVLREVVDALAEDGHLHFRGASVSIVGLVTANELCLPILGQRHLRYLHERSRAVQHQMRRMSKNFLVEQDQHVTPEQPRDAKSEACSRAAQSR